MNDSTALAALLITPEPDLGPGPRAGTQPLPALQAAIDAVLKRRPLPSATGEAARALVLLWHDHHETAHGMVQDLATAEASYVHAILHRREPDYGNAKYWLRRAGRHACHATLAVEADRMLAKPELAPLRNRLLPGGAWDALAFVEACEKGAEQKTLRALQAAEFRVLLDFLTV